jgi:hypothetical protein
VLPRKSYGSLVRLAYQLLASSPFLTSNQHELPTTNHPAVFLS